MADLLKLSSVIFLSYGEKKSHKRQYIVPFIQQQLPWTTSAAILQAEHVLSHLCKETLTSPTGINRAAGPSQPAVKGVREGVRLLWVDHLCLRPRWTKVSGGRLCPCRCSVKRAFPRPAVPPAAVWSMGWRHTEWTRAPSPAPSQSPRRRTPHQQTELRVRGATASPERRWTPPLSPGEDALKDMDRML